MRNKNLLLIAIVVIAVLLVGGWFVARQRGGQEGTPEELFVDESIEEISAEELGLTLSARADKKAVKFEITNTKDISAVDYELSYLAKGDIPRGVIGSITVVPGEKKIISDYLDLGSCSASVCKYDEGVTFVKLIVKITKTDGKLLQASKELEL